MAYGAYTLINLLNGLPVGTPTGCEDILRNKSRRVLRSISYYIKWYNQYKFLVGSCAVNIGKYHEIEQFYIQQVDNVWLA